MQLRRARITQNILRQQPFTIYPQNPLKKEPNHPKLH